MYSRYCFVFLSFSQTTAAVIAGCEATWGFSAAWRWELAAGRLAAVLGGA